MMEAKDATILIVDDEIQNRKLLEALLRPQGYSTISVASGEEALSSIANRAPDLILLDIMMPNMDGYQVARTLKANPNTANIPLIFVTALIDRNTRLAGLNAGAEEFLTKPVDRAELWLRVRNLLRLKALSDFQRDHNLMLEQQVQARTIELQRFRSAMEAAADAIFLVNRATMQFIDVNATACELLGYSRDELLELGPAEIGEPTREQHEIDCDTIITGQTTNALAQETRMRRKDGSTLQVAMHRHAQCSGAERIIVCVVRSTPSTSKRRIVCSTAKPTSH